MEIREVELVVPVLLSVPLKLPPQKLATPRSLTLPKNATGSVEPEMRGQSITLQLLSVVPAPILSLVVALSPSENLALRPLIPEIAFTLDRTFRTSLPVVLPTALGVKMAIDMSHAFKLPSVPP